MSSSADSDNHSIDNFTKNSPVSEHPNIKNDVVSDNEEQELVYFTSWGMDPNVLQSAKFASRRNLTTIQNELIANKQLEEAVHFQQIAERLELPYLDQIDPNLVIGSKYIDILLKRQGPLRITNQENIKTVISPSISEAICLEVQLARKPEFRDRLLIASPAVIRHTVWQFGSLEKMNA